MATQGISGIMSFNGGMNTDSDKSYRDGSMYLDAANYTRTPVESGTLGTMENVKGNKQNTDIEFPAGHTIVGHTPIVDNEVYFTTDGTTSNIYFYEDGVLNLVYSDANSSDSSRLNFSTNPDG